MTGDEEIPPFALQPLYDARQVDAYVAWLQGRMRSAQRQAPERVEIQSDAGLSVPPNALGFRLILDCPPDVETHVLDGMMSDLNALLKVTVFNAALVSEFDSVPGQAWAGETHKNISWNQTVVFTSNVKVRHLKYGSPLDWFGYISAGSLATSIAANRLLAVYRNFQKTRASRYETDTQIAAQQAIKLAIDKTSNGGSEFLERVAKDTIEAAARSLTNVRTFEAIESDGTVTRVDVKQEG